MSETKASARRPFFPINVEKAILIGENETIRKLLRASFLLANDAYEQGKIDGAMEARETMKTK